MLQKNSMKRLFLLIGFISLFPITNYAGPGDTTIVQAFTFNSPREGWVKFPSDTVSYEKVLMYYTLKCNPSHSPKCGEWDYLTYTNLYEHTGNLDSVMHMHPQFTANGNAPDTLKLLNNVSWSYHAYFQYFNNPSITDSASIGLGTKNMAAPLSSNSNDARSQFIYRASELTSAGLSADTLTAIKFYLNATNNLKNLKIRIKATSLDSLDISKVVDNGFTLVYDKHTNFANSGWNTLLFTNPFVWDGTSNLLIDISYREQSNTAINNITLKADSTSFVSSLQSLEHDFNLQLDKADFMPLQTNSFQQIDSFLTIGFWSYGDPNLLPSKTSLIVARDSMGRKVFNIHLPWSNGSIYWDAGNSGTNSYDRINKVATPAEYKGNWVYWTFTKNAKTGIMKIYKNGVVWKQGSGKTRLMNGIKTVMFGGATSKVNGYAGNVDDFNIWSTELTATEIQAIMYQHIPNNHPKINKLLYYYTLDEGQGIIAHDQSGNNNDFTLLGLPEWKDYQGINRMKNFTKSHLRPQIILGSGSFAASTLDSVFVLDSTANQPVMVILYNDTVHPNTNIPTDTLLKYMAYYRYKYNAQGVAYDSTFVAPDTVLVNAMHPYWDPPFEIINRWEIGRFITPYGNGLDLGNGFTWVFDVSDFEPLLHDSVELKAGNWQELLDLKFLCIEGTPARKVNDIHRIYQGVYYYRDASIEDKLCAKTVPLKNNSEFLKLRLTNTGHGMGGNQNCSEFCPRNNTIKVNGQTAFTEYLWRNTCDFNPLYPQGGTWIYSRANWCPGAEVSPYEYNLSSFLPDDSITVDYDMQSYTWNGQGSTPNYRIEGYLFEYQAASFSNDASIEDIVAPNKRKYYARYNPMAGQPIIVVKNSGEDTLKSLDIEYRVGGRGSFKTYHWTGSIPFMAKQQITLPAMEWWNFDGQKFFTCRLKNPNGTTDQYPYNNEMRSSINTVPEYPSTFVIWLRTNSQAYQTTIEIVDKHGNIVYTKSGYSNNTLYKDTITLPYGIYRLKIKDSGGNGLKFWANMPPYGNETAGYVWLKNTNGGFIKNLQADFGREIAQSFTVGFYLDKEDIPEAKNMLSVYPNPSENQFNISLGLVQEQDVRLTVLDLNGREIMQKEYKNIHNETLKLNLDKLPKGVYILRIELDNDIITKKLILQ
jgi:hypothetical protein